MADEYPQEAVDMLQKNPETWQQFKETFGSLPNGFDPPRPSDEATSAAVDSAMESVKPTTLDEKEEPAYRTWLENNGMTKANGYNVDDNYTGTDYDLRGYFKKYGPTDVAPHFPVSQGKHLTDEFKLPNHKTFSDQSIYAQGEAHDLAGRWNGDEYTPPAPKEALDILKAHPETKDQFVSTFGYDPTPPIAPVVPHKAPPWAPRGYLGIHSQEDLEGQTSRTTPSDIAHATMASTYGTIGALPQIPAAIARFTIGGNQLGQVAGMEENVAELGAQGYHWAKQFLGFEPKAAKPLDPEAARQAEVELGMGDGKERGFDAPKILPPPKGEPDKPASTFFPAKVLETTEAERKAGENVTRAFKPFTEKMQDWRRESLQDLTPEFLTATMGATDWKNPTSIVAKAVDLAPYLLINRGIGGTVAKLAATSKIAELAKVAMPQSMKAAAAEEAARRAVTAAGTIANGGIMGAATAQGVSDAINQLPEEEKMKFEEYRVMRLHGYTDAYATQALASDRAHASILAGAVGGGLSMEFMGPLFSKMAVARAVPGSKVFSGGAAALGMGLDTALSGAAQGAAMKVGENIGLKPNKEGLWDGVGDQALAFAMLNMAMTGAHVVWHGMTAKDLAQPLPSVEEIAKREREESAKASADKEVDAASKAEANRLATENARVKLERLQAARKGFLEANEAVNQITTAANDPHQSISYNEYERAHNRRLDAFNEFREAAEDAGLVQPKGEKSGEAKTEGSDRAPSVGQVRGQRRDLNGETGGGLRQDVGPGGHEGPEGERNATVPAPSERQAGQLLKPLSPEEGPLGPDERPIAIAAGKPKITPKAVPSEEVGPMAAGKPKITLKVKKPITDKDFATNYAQIPADDTLAPDKKRVENRMRAIVADVPTAAAAYAKLPESDGGRIINTDTVRELSPDYSKDNVSRSEHAASVQEPSSWMAERLYEQRMSQPASTGKDPVVLFTAGGSDSGKSVSLGSDDAKRADTVYDGNMNNLQKARRRIRMALDGGRDVHIQFTYRDPIEAFRGGVLPRAMKFGRTVPVEAHAGTHNGSFKTVMAIAKQYAGDSRVQIQVIDTAAGKETTLKGVAEKRYDVTPEQLHKIAAEEYQNGRITEAVFRGISGKRADRVVRGGKDHGQLPGERVGGPDKPAAAEQPEKGEAGHLRGEGGDRGQPQEKAGLGEGIPGKVQVEDLKKSSAILSAERSNLSAAENAKRTEELGKKLTEAGLNHQRAQGVYKGGAEGSFVIHARNPEDHEKVRELGKEFNQESTLHTVGGESRLHFDDHAESIGNLHETTKADAESRDNYTKLDDGRYLVTDKPGSYKVAEKPAKKTGRVMEFRHFSNLKDDTVTLDPTKYGTGIKGEEARRGGIKTISLYGKNHPDSMVEGNLRQQTEYVVRVPESRLYDLSKDPQGFLDKHDNFNNVEKAIRDAGFRGYHLPRGEGIFKGQARLFGETRAVRKGVSLSAGPDRGAGFWNQQLPPGSRAPVERRGGMRTSEFEKAVSQARVELPGLNMRTVEHPSEIPNVSKWDAEHLAIQAVFQERPDGGYQIYLVRPNLHTAEDVRNAIYHEGVGHMGVRFMLSRNGTYESTMGQIWKQYEPIVRKFKVSESTRKNLDSADPEIRDSARHHAAEELFAHAAGSRQLQKQGTFQKIIAIVREALRKIGLLKNFSEQDIARLIDRARDYVATGKSKRDALADYASIRITGRPVKRDAGGEVQAFKAKGKATDEVRNTLAKIGRYLLPSEKERLSRVSAKKIVDLFKSLPSAKEFANVALAGKAKRGWYKQSAETLHNIFGPDAPRFSALLAATSPQTGVEMNLRNAVKIWKTWTDRGRPTDRNAIFKVMADSVTGHKGGQSVLPAWINNTVRALSHEDPGALTMSGPKVNSFMKNLQGVTHEVTLDTWMANFAKVNQTLFSGGLKAAGSDPGKRPGYLGYAARVREAADTLSKMTGETWTPAEVQETVWSWAKTVSEHADSFGALGSAVDLVRDKEITDELINATPDFNTLFRLPEHDAILRGAGYGKQLDQLHASGAIAGAEAETQAPSVAPEQKHLLAAAKRLDEVRSDRAASRSQPSFKAAEKEEAISAPDAPIWHSALIRQVEALPQNSATAEQWIKTIDNLTQKGVKKAEIDWMGIREDLSRHWSSKDVGDPLKRKVSKEDLLKVLNASRLQLSEKELSGSSTREYDMGDWKTEEPDMDLMKESAEEEFKTQFPEEQEFVNEYQQSKEDWIENEVQKRAAMYYDDPESPSSRTITVTSGDNEAHFQQSHSFGDNQIYNVTHQAEVSTEGYEIRGRLMDNPQTQNALDSHLDDVWGSGGLGAQYGDYTLPGGDNYRELLMTMPEPRQRWGTPANTAEYVGSHFDEPNIIAHMRLKDRVDSEGKKMLFAEEIQSDWHQQGREKGYFPDKEMEDKIAALEAQVDEHMSKFPEKDRAIRGNERLDLEATKQLAELRAQQRLAKRSRVPDAPHKTTWPELALKRLIRYAADNGYDKIGWTTGDQQNERYGLGKHINRLTALYKDGEYNILGYKQGSMPAFERQVVSETMPEEKLAEFLGGDLAKRIIADQSASPDKIHEYDNQDLHVGGDGMRSFYDKMIPSMAHKLTKKYGGAVGVSKIHTGGGLDKRTSTVHSLDLNPLIVEASRSGPLSSSFSAGETPEMKSFLDKINPKPRPWGERMKGFMKSLRHEFADRVFDDFYGIEKAFREGGKKGPNLGFMSAHLSRNDGELMSIVVEKGHPIWTDGAPAVKPDTVGLEDILKPLGAKVDDFFRAMVARRASRLMAEGREHLFTPEEVNAGMKLWDNNPDFERAFTELATLKRGVLDFAQEAGVVNAANRLMWENDDYIPFYRIMNQTGDVLGSGAGGALGKVKAQVRRLKGGQAALGDPMENLLQNWHSLIKASLKNKAAQVTVDSLADTGIVTKINAPNSTTLTKEAFKARAAELGVDTDKVPRQAWDQLYASSAYIPEDPNTFHIWRNGTKEHYTTTDPYLYRAIASMSQNGKSAFVEMAKSVLGLPKRAITFGITRSPVFPLKNLARDMLSLFVTGDAARHQLMPAFIPVLDSVKGAVKYMRGGQDVTDLQAAGGIFDAGYSYGSPSKVASRLKRDLNKSATGKVIHGAAIGARLYVHLIDASESAHRLAVAQGVRNAGKGRIEQAYAARDVLNFSSGGSNDLLKFMMSTVPFLKAGLSGLYMTGRRVHQNPSGVLLRGSIMALASVAYAYLHKDDQRYKDLPPDQKTNYWHFFDVVHQGDHWKLPKPFEIGALFATVPEAFADAALSDEPDRIKQGAGQIGNALSNAISYDWLPVGVRPFYDLATNKQAYSGSPILTQGDQQVLPIAQDAPYVAPTYRFLAQNAPQSFPVWTQSPKQLQYVARGFTGTLGDYVTAMTDILVRKATGQTAPASRGVIQDMPGVSQIVSTGDPRRTKQSDSMYAIANKIAEDYATAKKILATDPDKVGEFMDEHAEEMAVKDVYEGATSRVSDLKKAQVQLQQSNDFTPQEKQELLDQFQQEINDIAEKVYDYRPGGKLNPETMSKLIGKNVTQKANILTQSGMPATAALLRSWPQGLAA